MNEFNRTVFAELLKKAQGQRSINQYAAETGISAAHISRLMRSLLPTPPEVNTIRKLADKAQNHVSYEELMEAAGHFHITTPMGELHSLCNSGISLQDILILLSVIKERLLPLFRTAEVEKRGEKSSLVTAIDSICDDKNWNSGQLIILRHIIESISLRKEEYVDIPLHCVDQYVEKIKEMAPEDRKNLTKRLIDEYF